jgi:hypothetical protein
VPFVSMSRKRLLLYGFNNVHEKLAKRDITSNVQYGRVTKTPMEKELSWIMLRLALDVCHG